MPTQFFAHCRRDDCESEPDLKEHLLAKATIALACRHAGWSAVTECQGRGSDGTKWRADVLAESPRQVHVAFNVVWRGLSDDELRARQQSLRGAGTRGAWFVRLHKRRKYSDWDLIDEQQTPVFGIRWEEGADVCVPKFGVKLHEFVIGMLRGDLRWSPSDGQIVTAELIVAQHPCWKCGIQTGIVLGTAIVDREGRELDFWDFDDPRARTLVTSMLTDQIAARHRIGQLKQRYSRTVRGSYLSNGCFHCDAIFGNFFLVELACEESSFRGTLPSVCSKPFVLGRDLPNTYGRWTFQDSEGEYFY